MTRKLIIARHAKSDWSYDLPDHERPLNARGLADAPRMGRLLKAYELSPDLILSSPAVRAKSTAELISASFDVAPELRVEPVIYDGNYAEVYELLTRLPASHEQVMVFGHNPILQYLSIHLLQLKGSLELPTLGMVCLEFFGNGWSDLKPGYCVLKWFLIPRLIKHFKG